MKCYAYTSIFLSHVSHPDRAIRHGSDVIGRSIKPCRLEASVPAQAQSRRSERPVDYACADVIDKLVIQTARRSSDNTPAGLSVGDGNNAR
ncbi:hypothetical protein J6590_047014 [Homalodisca vitripennis]|nr:hypothetical protein J6590_047014 [Homalodisca vitripennis]